MSFKSADGYRRFYQDVSGHLLMAAADGDTTLVTVKNSNYTLYIQRIVVYITTDAAQSWAFEDNNGTPKKIFEVTTSPGDETRWEFWAGDKGVPLTAGKNFVLNASAAGLAGSIEWEGYQVLNNGTAASST